MYIPLHMRLTLFYAIVLALALWFFGNTVYTQAEQRAYRDLDDTLKSRAASVRLGKYLLINDSRTPIQLSSVDGFGTGGVAIEVLQVTNNDFQLLATTTGLQDANDPMQTGLVNPGFSPVPWDAQSIHKVMQQSHYGGTNDTYNTITYQGQHIRVYTLQNPDSMHFIQTARSEQDIEQSLSNLRLLLLQGGALVMVLALLGGWLISWGVLNSVRRMTRTAQSISASRDFSKRVPSKTLLLQYPQTDLKKEGFSAISRSAAQPDSLYPGKPNTSNGPTLGRDELDTLAITFNQMLSGLEDAYQRQQRFVADASHELRAPITSIRCNLDLLAKAPDLPSEEVQGALADARAEAERMGRLVSDLLLLAHADEVQSSGVAVSDAYKKYNGYAQEVDLDSLLLTVFRQYRPLDENGDNGQKLEGPRLLLQHIMPVKVYGDTDQLKQTLIALVDNALKYTPQEGYVTLSLSVAEDCAIVRVSDTGIGISPEDLPHIFERFYRANRARTRDRGGSGLGLAIVQSIVQEHGGSVEVESTPGKGSTFTLKLPTADVTTP
ncbi:MAG: HAMP domain-containing protein [Chloroflexi bacterium]|nr:HAMP domain-containing protein [Chloroflexota bacterium]